jgi:DNA-directed RNA polymerase subunit M/transcription elongation factor TFIIS
MGVVINKNNAAGRAKRIDLFCPKCSGRLHIAKKTGYTLVKGMHYVCDDCDFSEKKYYKSYLQFVKQGE